LKVSLIWAQDKNGLIGIDDSLPWDIPEDLKRFKEKTTNKMVVMSSRTFASIGKPLPNRTNIVLSNKSTSIPGFPNVKVLTFAGFKRYVKDNDSKTEIMVIGGAEIYKLFLPFATKLYVTKVGIDALQFNKQASKNTSYLSNHLVYFPEIDFSNYVCSSYTFNKRGSETKIPFTFEQYKRKR